MSTLVRYEQARTALAECHRVDEVKDIRDKAEAMAAYARQAKDQELILWATEIKVRAERKAGELLTQARESGERAGRGKPAADSNSATLHELGIAPHNATRWQQLASMTDDHFEAAVATAKDTAGQVTTAFMLREAGRARAPAKKLTKVDKQRLERLSEAKSRGVSMLTTYARLTLTALRSQSEFSDDERDALSELLEAIEEVSAST